MPRIPSPVFTTAGLIGGYLAARTTKRRELGGAVLAAGGAAAFATWRRAAGAPTAGALTALYLGAFGASHPLAKRIGAWPSVLSVAAVTGAAAYVIGDRRAVRG